MREGKWAKFKYWFTNIFWYHYRQFVIIGVFVLGVAVYLIVDAVNTPKPDFEFIVFSPGYVTDEQTGELQSIAEQAIGDLNGDGKVYISLVGLSIIQADTAEMSVMKLGALMSDPKVVLYIMETEAMELYVGDNIFTPLSELGIDAPSEDGYTIRVDQLPVFLRSGLSENEGDPWQFSLAFRVKPEGKKYTKEVAAAYEAAIAYFNALASSQ